MSYLTVFNFAMYIVHIFVFKIPILERKPIRTAKDKDNERKVKLNDGPSETDVATSAELIAAVNGTDPMDLEDSLQAGQTGGELTVEETSNCLQASFGFILLAFPPMFAYFLNDFILL